MVAAKPPPRRRGPLERAVRWLAVFLWVALILLLGSSYFSKANTGIVIDPILRWLYPYLHAGAISHRLDIVRWSAHFGEYAILALFLVLGPLRRYPLGVLMVCLACAFADEGLQWFDPARTSSILDVALDFSGATTVVMLLTPVWMHAQVRPKKLPANVNRASPRR